MRIYENGVYRDATQEEIAAYDRELAKLTTAERKRELTAEEITAMLIRARINDIDADDETAWRMRSHYPAWAEGKSYTVGYKVQHGGALHRCLQAHTSQLGWEPDAAPTLWVRIDETHDGSEFDPIPYAGNMELKSGLYYTEGGKVYRCTRDTGIAVHAALGELVGLYVEEVGGA